MHEFFKTIRVHTREQVDSNRRSSRDRQLLTSTTSGESQSKIQNKPNCIKCYNCHEIGHPSFKYPNPIIKCTICNLLGRVSSNCKPKENEFSQKDKNILNVTVCDNSSDKYRIVIKVNRNLTLC